MKKIYIKKNNSKKKFCLYTDEAEVENVIKLYIIEKKTSNGKIDASFICYNQMWLGAAFMVCEIDIIIHLTYYKVERHKRFVLKIKSIII